MNVFIFKLTMYHNIEATATRQSDNPPSHAIL